MTRGNFRNFAAAHAPWRRLYRSLCAGMVLACVLLAAPQAMAQTRSVVTRTNTAKATIVRPLSLLVSQRLDFGKIAPRPTAGTVILNPNNALCTTTGTIIHVGNCLPAVFAGRGTGTMTMRIQIDGNVTIRGTGGTMLLDTFTLNPSPGLTLQGGGVPNGSGNQRFHINSPTGIFTFSVGGTLHVGANQRAGVYSGTFAVQAEYF